MTKYIGILTSGGDSPGLNAAIRGVGKASLNHYGMHIIGFRDGFRGLMENRTMRLDGGQLSDILTRGGTILGTSRDKPHRMPVGGKVLDMTDVIVGNYHDNHLDALVCLGGGGTQKNALRLKEKGLNVITLPKTIDNDVAMTDTTFGFDTALGIATEAIDRLHSTAHSHHRIIVVEIMGHRAGWLALGAGIAGGADVILIPEIPYEVESVAEAIRERSRSGKPFSIVAVAEGAISMQEHLAMLAAQDKKPKTKGGKKGAAIPPAHATEIQYADHTLRLAKKLEQLTGLEARVTILGHLQRGGIPSAADRLLATRLGTACADLINEGHYGVMVAAKGDGTRAVKLDDVAGKVKTVPPDHPWVESARRVGTNMGD
ncbi:MAG: ATP-dependent 6-phosphofructokinase [Sulfurimicrobium sp.]|nr:ATP-dependent 6-phosphofructokinase [Sulfurimicrobium sp.]MDO9227115.1 ATP-dependent 6-phosphofructokinase [Pseudomonadota bacterium]MDP1705717.1 ATP-dependent 6-phosphofructokinase [Sulfurimicrobium sp.]MDP1896268.1 ATP-dependent 6-phosphofructokinase [Sulfurimicrobium sp.]MDP2200233.1 ATP-dependent 6-phosphofructokinase [Sulfurimicrobium sp.]